MPDARRLVNKNVARAANDAGGGKSIGSGSPVRYYPR